MIYNLKNSIRLLFLLIILIVECNIFYNFTSQENIEEKIAVLKSLATQVDIDSEDFSFLDDVLKDNRIVLLGEQLHSDGTAFEIKSQIIKYLHENLGYNVVLYEAGLYDIWYMDMQDTIKPQMGLYNFWWDNDECRPIWDYYQKCRQSENPIVLGGFDVQLTGQIDNTTRSELIKNHLSGKNIDLNEYPAFDKVINRLSQNWLWEFRKYNKILSETLHDSIQTDLSLILSELEKMKKNDTDEIYYRYLSGIKDYNELRWDYNPGDLPRMNIRDSLMADNLIWLANEFYKDEKIIVWAANIHIFNSGNQTFKPMGAYIKERFEDEKYSMVFTSYARKKRNGHLYNVASNKSVEYLLHSSNNKFSYIDMKNVSGNSFLNEDVISTVNQMMSVKNNWKNQFDGVFYIDVVTPLGEK